MNRSRCHLAVALALAALGTGCTSGTQESGIRIGNETLRQFKAGTTTCDWLVAVLGQPTSCSVVTGIENTQVLRYATSERSGGLMSALTGGSSRSTAVVYFIVTDGIVTRFWADRATEHTLLGKQVEIEPGSKESPAKNE